MMIEEWKTLYNKIKTHHEILPRETTNIIQIKLLTSYSFFFSFLIKILLVTLQLTLKSFHNPQRRRTSGVRQRIIKIPCIYIYVTTMVMTSIFLIQSEALKIIQYSDRLVFLCTKKWCYPLSRTCIIWHWHSV